VGGERETGNLFGVALGKCSASKDASLLEMLAKSSKSWKRNEA